MTILPSPFGMQKGQLDQLDQQVARAPQRLLGALEGSRSIWIADDGAPRRNQFIRFERHFELTEVPASLVIHLFADTRYRLRVNGVFVATGPGRFVTQFPEYDSHELTALLKVGMNQMSVEVNFFGASSYQSMPDGEPGFIAAGSGGMVDFATPGEWMATRQTAWRWDAPLFSFAQSPVEICDTRRIEGGELAKIVPCTKEPWGEFRPYSGLPIPYFRQDPQQIIIAGSLQDDEVRIGLMAHDPLAAAGKKEILRPWAAFATWIHSSEAQRVQASVFWSDLFLNGHPVQIDTSTALGNHAHTDLDLREGWNLLTGHFCILTEYWAYCLGFPKSAHLSLHARQDRACPEPWSVSGNGGKETIPLPRPGDESPPEGWAAHPGDVRLVTPARLMGWEIPSTDALRDLAPEALGEVGRASGPAFTWGFSFEGDFLGHIVLDVEGPEGSILDVGVDDWQHEHGGVALYRSNPFTDAVDRFVLKGGRQQIELFHPRGGKFIQVILRAPREAASGKLILHDLFVRSRQSLGTDQTSFTCDEPVLEWAWPVAMRTLLSSTDEAYSDCPWRERGSYIGDGYVNVHLNAILSGDLRIAARVLRVFGQAQLPNGQLACCAPSWLREPLEDFTLIWILALHDYWIHTGDLSLVEEMWPVVQRIWSSSAWEPHSSGLWNTNHHRTFIDWGVLNSERSGNANAVLNVLRIAAGRVCAKLASALGRAGERDSFQNDAEKADASLWEVLWNENEGRLDASEGALTPAIHANILAMALQVGTPQQRERLLDYLEPHLCQNFSQGLAEGEHSGHLELFYLVFALPALAEHGRPDLAERLIREHYGYLQSLGYDTLPEYFHGADRAVGSRCHSWSGAAAIYASRYILGIRPSGDGHPSHLIFDPVVDGIHRASGKIAHRDGWIEVSWEKIDGEIHHRIVAPAGVEIEVKTSDSATQEAVFA